VLAPYAAMVVAPPEIPATAKGSPVVPGVPNDVQESVTRRIVAHRDPAAVVVVAGIAVRHENCCVSGRPDVPAVSDEYICPVTTRQLIQIVSIAR